MSYQPRWEGRIDPSKCSTLPEVHYNHHDDNLPEVYYNASIFPEAVTADTRERGWGDNLPSYHSQQVPEPEKKPRVGWLHRRRNIIIVGVVIALVVIIAAVAIGVVLSRRKSDVPQNSDIPQSPSDSKDNPAYTTSVTVPTATQLLPFGTPTNFPAPNGINPPSSCPGGVCPQMLSSVNIKSSKATLLFGRGTDNMIWYRTVFTSGAASSWNGDWTSLGGSFGSQPAAISTGNGRVYVFGIWKDDRSTRYKIFQNGVWESDWTSLSGVATSQPVLSTLDRDNIMVATIRKDNAVWRKFSDDAAINWLPEGRTADWEDDGGLVSRSIGNLGIPRDDTPDHVSYYAEAGCGPSPGAEFKYRMWNSSAFFYNEGTDWSSGGVSCKGDPILVSFGNEIAYFLVGTDSSIVSISTLRNTGAITKRGVSLGGSFQSVVDVLTTGTSRMDVLAVGKDARLKHRAYIDGKGWAPDWEDLGGYFYSAPRAVQLNDTAVAVFGIGPNGNVIHGTFGIGGNTDFLWGAQQWYADGGNISTVIYV